VQPISDNNRSPRIENLPPAHEIHEVGSARLMPRYVRKVIRFVSNFSPTRLVRMRRGKSVVAVVAIVVAGGYLFAGEANRSHVIASASSFAGLELSKLVIKGNVNLDPAEIQEMLGSQLGQTMFEFDVAVAREKVDTINWVRKSTVRKVFPDTIIIQVQEFEPFALWKVEDTVNLISTNGSVIGRAAQRHMLLPQVVGVGANKEASVILAAVQQYPEIAERTKAFVRVGKRRWNIVMKDGLRVMLPENEWREALENLNAMHVERQLLDREMVQVDLRLPDRMIMKLKHEDAEVRKTVIRDALKKDWHKI